MATTQDYIEYVCERLPDCGNVRYRKMFSEYMVYINDKPLLTVCDNTVFVKKVPELATVMANAAVGCPYEGAKEHYILDIDDTALTAQVIATLEPITPLPKNERRHNFHGYHHHPYRCCGRCGGVAGHLRALCKRNRHHL